MSALRLSRRGLFGGLAALVAAPAIVRVASIMPVVVVPDEAALHRLLEQRLENYARTAANELSAEWDRRMYADGTNDGPGGLAELIQGRTTPDRRIYQRYSWVPMAWPT